jgi:hypothetical protein
MPSIAGSSVIVRRTSPGWRYGAESASLLFPPKYLDASTAQEGFLHILRRDPAQFGLACSRWTLAKLLSRCRDWLRVATLSGLWQVLQRVKIHWKHARQHVHSPDPEYVAKLGTIKLQLLRVPCTSQVLLFSDEFTMYRQPSVTFG